MQSSHKSPEGTPSSAPVERDPQQETWGRYLEAIHRPDLKEKITPETPLVYYTVEIYRPKPENGPADIQGQGGLGMLAGDTLETAKKIGMPAVFMTLFYPKERIQEIENLSQKTRLVDADPESRGFEKLNAVTVQTLVNGNSLPRTVIEAYTKKEGSVTLVALTEKNLGELYQGENNSDHRLYQEVVLGMAGHKIYQQLGKRDAALTQLNEAPTVMAAIAQVDEKVLEAETARELEHGTQDDLEITNQALEQLKKSTLYTNHTLVQAAEAEFTLDQFERFVVPNILSNALTTWLRDKFNGKGGKLRLSTLAIELSGRKNGVSRIHAQESRKAYRDYDGNPVPFEPVTNGISLERWGNPQLLDLYKEAGIIDEFGLVAPDYREKIDALDPATLEAFKRDARLGMRRILEGRRNQYGEHINIPAEAKVFNWKRRIAEYKRPGMLFESPQRLAQILESKDGYLVMAGKAHPDDLPMQAELTRILKVIEAHPVLQKRVHFLQNYDEIAARAMAQGADTSINTPRVRNEHGPVSTEACGTSWEKDILNNTILISTPDGGVADPILDGSAPSFLEIHGMTYEEEVEELYKNMEKAAGILEGKEKYEFLKKQLKEYLPIISGSRMEKDYLELVFPKP